MPWVKRIQKYWSEKNWCKNSKIFGVKISPFLTCVSGINCVSLSWLDDVHKNGLISEKQSSCVECLVDTTIPQSNIIGVSLLTGRIPNSPSFDGPVLCCATSSGPGILIPLLSLPTALTKEGQNNRTSQRSEMPNIINKLKSLLEKKPTRLLPTNGVSLPIGVSLKQFKNLTPALLRIYFVFLII